MRSLALLALVTVAALPLSAHDHWRERRPVVVVQDSCRPAYRWEDRRWENRRERHGYHRSYDRRYDGDDYRSRDCDGDRVLLRPLLRPLAPPFEGRVVLRFR